MDGPARLDRNFVTVPNGDGSRERKGREFSDSEVYKIVEAMSISTPRWVASGSGRATPTSPGATSSTAPATLQAAVARTRTVGGNPLLDVARRAADHVCEVFEDQAALFVDRFGHRSLPAHEFGWSYFNDDVPVRKATVLRGHAVRSLYLACGAVDVAVETGDDDLLGAVAEQVARTWARRTHITGGMGSRHQDEAFGDDFVLPKQSHRFSVKNGAEFD